MDERFENMKLDLLNYKAIELLECLGIREPKQKMINDIEAILYQISIQVSKADIHTH